MKTKLKNEIEERLIEELEKVAKYLPNNYSKDVYTRMNEEYSRPYILMVRAGVRSNIRIVQELIQLAKEERDRINKVLEQ